MKKLLMIACLLSCSIGYADSLLPVYSQPVKISTIQTTQIQEASGISISIKNPGIAWIHNDSGNSATVWGIRLSDGTCSAKINMIGASNKDIEAIALGNYHGVETLFLGDIGDNDLNRGTYYVNVLAEPDIKGMTNCQSLSINVKKIKFKYPKNAKFNAESLMFSPETQKLYIITKAAKTDFLEFTTMDTTSGVTNYLQKLGNFPLSTVTAADMSRDGEGLLIRTYDAIHEVRKLRGQDIYQFLQGQLVSVPAPSEPQGEAVGYDVSGSYYTVSEGNKPPIYKITKTG